MEALPEHTIHISGLKDGAHVFDFELGEAFFTTTGNDDYQGGEVKARVDLAKSDHMLVATIHVDGYLTMACDHCNAPMHQPVKGEQRQIFQLTGETGIDDEELVALDPHASEINLTHYFFECIALHLPARHVHPEGQCDPEVDAALRRIELEHEPVPDPRWEALKKLKTKK